MSSESIQALLGIAFGIFIGVVLYKKKILDFWGAVSAILMGAAVSFFGGYKWLLLLVVFLALGVFSTNYRYSFKEKMRVAEKNRGMRNASNVLANGIVPTFFAVLWYVAGAELDEYLKAAYLAGVAAATGDTLSSEIGVLSRKKPVLITTLGEVPVGTHGGISAVGEAAGIAGALVIGTAAWMLNFASFQTSILAALIGGAAGFHFDSFLGAVFERRGMISNATVNFLSTIAGSLAGLAVIWV